MTTAQFARKTGIPVDAILDTPLDEFAWGGQLAGVRVVGGNW